MNQKLTFFFTEKQLELINDKITATVSVISPNNFPHVTPVGIVELNGKIYFSSELGRVKTKYLQKNKNVAINILHPKGFPYMTIEGKGSIKTPHDFPYFNEVLSKIAKKSSSTIEEFNGKTK